MLKKISSLKTSGKDAAEDSVYMNDVNAAIFDSSPIRGHLLLWITTLFVITALVWAHFATLDELTRGTGKIIPSSHLQVIQNLEGGIVSEIFVKEGQVVEKDQPLVRLDDVRFSSSFKEEKIKRLGLLASIVRLEALAHNTNLVLPSEIEKNHPDLAQHERQLYHSKKAELASTIETVQQQVKQREQELIEVASQQKRLLESYAMLDKEVKMSEPLVGYGAMSEVELLRLKRSANDLQGELNAARLSEPRLQAALSEAKNKINEQKAQFNAAIVTELKTTKAEFERIAESIETVKDQVKRALVISPIKGTIKQLKVATIGGVIQPGMDLLEIVPFEDELLIEANILPADIAFLRPGQKAVIKLTAYDFSIYGGLEAKLKHISADTLVNAEDGKSYYQIRLSTTQNHIVKNGEKLNIIPGMTADVDILTGKKTVLDYLLKPILKTQANALHER
ncbi:MAG: HlyD family type I secretion periplasmic adaptor subunit [Methylococcaceae bacterium]|nr:HlyD family type I secretion periplasmic adaptor subunit [Methylococcaceae bacterium]